MNNLEGKIVSIDVSGSMSIVTVEVAPNLYVKSIVIETPKTASYLQKGNTIKVLFKETEVVIGKEANLAISLQNRFQGTVTAVEKGSLISKVEISTQVGTICSIVSTSAVQQLSIADGTNVVAMIKLNEIMFAL